MPASKLSSSSDSHCHLLPILISGALSDVTPGHVHVGPLFQQGMPALKGTCSANISGCKQGDA